MPRAFIAAIVLLGCLPALGAEPERRIVEAFGGPSNKDSSFVIPLGMEGVVEDYYSKGPPGLEIPDRKTTVYSEELRGHIGIRADPDGRSGTVLRPGRYWLIADGGGGARARLVYRLEPRSRLPPVRRAEPMERRPESEEQGYRGPLVRALAIVPMGEAPMDETQGLIEVLRRRFPGLEFRLEPPRPLPRGILNEQGQVRGPVLARWMLEPGSLAIVTKDLAGGSSSFRFGMHEPTRAVGVVSVARMRTRSGKVAPAGATLHWRERDLSRVRLQNELTRTLGRLLVGGRRPCHEGCALRHVCGVGALDDGGEFCEQHAREVREAVARMTGKAN